LASAGDKVRRGLAVLRSFLGVIKVKVGEVEYGLDIEPATGTADSGDLEADLPNLLAASPKPLRTSNGSRLTYRRNQFLKQTELSALIMACTRCSQSRLPLVLVGAGLPILPGLAGESKSYAERLFSFPIIGALSESDAAKALQDPVERVGWSLGRPLLSGYSRSLRDIRTSFRNGDIRHGTRLRPPPSH